MTIASDIASSSPVGSALALLHTTSAMRFRKICVESVGKLKPQTCPVMGIDLTYLFYGRPAYRPGRIAPTDRDRDSRPVCMLFDREAVNKIHGLFPCDTGAHDRHLYSPFLDGVSLADLDCAPTASAEKRIVFRYFDNNQAYFYGEQRSALVPKATSSVAQAYFQLLSSDAVTECDDRARTIEITIDTDLDLATTLRAVIAPDFLWLEPDVVPFFDAWQKAGIDVKPYRPQSQTNAARTVERMFVDVGRLQGIAA